MKPETEARYRRATEAHYKQPLADEEWAEIIGLHIRQRQARDAVARGVANRTIFRRPCQMEGCRCPETDGHHPDYNHPRAVVWLCRSHHAIEHARLRKLPEEARRARNKDMLELAERNMIPDVMRSIFDPFGIFLDAFSGRKAEPPTVQPTTIEYDEDAYRDEESPNKQAKPVKWYETEEYKINAANP